MSSVIDLLADLVSIPSVNPLDTGVLGDIYGENRVVDYLVSFCQAHGLDCERTPCLPGRDNLLVRLEGRNSGPGIVLEAHTDTVAAVNMSVEPFTPAVREGKMTGRGACDCKASLAAMLTALVEVKASGTPPFPCTLLCAADEEYHFEGVRAALDGGLEGAVGLVGEPTGLDVVIAHKGALRMKLITRGIAAHSSDPSRGRSAVYAMVDVLDAVRDYGRLLGNAREHPLSGGPTASVGIVRGGEAFNIVPDYCEAYLDRRLRPDESPDEAKAELLEFLENRLGKPVETETLLADPGMEVSPDCPVARRAAAATQSVTGQGKLCGVKYGTDASKLVAGGIPSVVCGPGHIIHAHTVDEWIELEQVEAAVGVYRAFVEMDTPLI